MADRDSAAYDVVVIGAGTAGLAAARGVAAAGQRVALVESDRSLGGECPNYACVPTKTLLKLAKTYAQVTHAEKQGIELSNVRFTYATLKAHKDHVVTQTAGQQLTAERLAEQGVTLIRGRARFVAAHTLTVGSRRLTSRQFVLATGAHTALPPIDGIEHIPYLTSRTFLDLVELPDSVLILGAGPVGVEYAQILSALGTDVMLVDATDRILPHEEPETTQAVATTLTQAGVELLTGVLIDRVEGGPKQVIATTKDGKTLKAERLLLATGQAPTVEELNLPVLGLEPDRHGLRTNQYLQTQVPYVWAAGDVRGEALLTNVAHAEGMVVAHNLTHRQHRAIDLRVVPRVLFTHLELASVGETEARLRAAGLELVVGIAPLDPLGRALTDGHSGGLVKLVADAVTGQVLGASIAAPHAGEMIHELALAMAGQVTVSTIATMLHAYPTYSEAIAQAAGTAARELKSATHR